jgi:alpha-tubulin suppressor-like RCC1 family protein
MATHLYQWGIIYDSQSQKRIKCHVPKQMITNQRLDSSFQQVTCGTNYTLVLDSNHRVFILGDEPKYGRLGQGDDKTIVPILSLIKGRLPPIDFISSGPSTSILLTIDRRELWGFGKGISYQVQQIFQCEEIITHCICGENSIIIVLNGSQIKERRFNRDGFITEWICVYQLNDINDKIQHIDIGSSVNGFVTEQGHVYLWGSTVPIGKVSTIENFRNISIENAIQKDLVNDDRPIQISCSRGQFHAHILLLTEQGCIYSMGSNYKAKLGIDKDQLFTGEWILIELTRTCPFKMVAAGGIHSSALSVDGRVFTWGCGSDGRLGHSEAQGHRYLYKENEPRSVDVLNKQQVISIATSYYHMAAIVVQ